MQRPPSPRQESLWISPMQVPDTVRRRQLRQIDALLDFGMARQMAEPCFSKIGRPAIPVERMLKAMLAGCLLGITTDRRLTDDCADSLALREFLGLGLDEAMFSHSSFTNWRKRLGPDFFRRCLHDLVRQCQAHGMQLSQTRTVDATTIKAQASTDGPVVMLPREIEISEYVTQAFADDLPELPAGGDRIPVNLHDPEARLQRKGKEPAEFAFQGSICADPESGLITDATATPTERAQTAVEHVDRDPGTVRELVADGLYDHGETLGRLQERTVTTYVPRGNHDTPGQLSKDQFSFDADADCYRCPNGCVLTKRRAEPERQRWHYQANAGDCRACPLKAQCTRAKSRSIKRSYHEPGREQAVRSGPRYRYMQRQRRISEHYNMLGKRDHGLRRARSLGLAAACIQVALTAMAVDIGKLLRFLATHDAPAAAAISAVAGATLCPDAGASLLLACWDRIRRLLWAIWGHCAPIPAIRPVISPTAAFRNDRPTRKRLRSTPALQAGY